MSDNNSTSFIDKYKYVIILVSLAIIVIVLLIIFLWPKKCIPNCTDKLCGDDGCGGSCGTCQGSQSCTTNGQCICNSPCGNKQCGVDGCGNPCGNLNGNCFQGNNCNDQGQCKPCTPNCGDNKCGADANGCPCGSCDSGSSCINGKCVCNLPCGNKQCSVDGCGNTCGAGCKDNEYCNDGLCYNLPMIYIGGCNSINSIYWSEDFGKSWSSLDFDASMSCCKVISSNESVLLVGTEEIGVSSSTISIDNGYGWKPTTGLENMSTVRFIIWNNTTRQWICGGVNMLAFSKDNGNTWIADTTFKFTPLSGIWIGKWVIGVVNGIVYYDENSGWVQVNNFTNSVTSLCWNENVLLAGCVDKARGNVLLYSTDGQTWINIPPLTKISTELIISVFSITFSKIAKRWVAICTDSVNDFYMIYSDDMKNWFPCSDQPFNQCQDIKYIANSFVSCGMDSNLKSSVCYSTDGTKWTKTNVDIQLVSCISNDYSVIDSLRN